MMAVLATTTTVTTVSIPAIAAPSQPQPLTITGQLDVASTADGKESPIDADVYIYPKPKGKGTVAPLGHAKAASDGTFSLTAPSSELAKLGAAKDNGGWHHFMVVAYTADQVGLSVLSRRLEATQWRARGESALTASPNVPISVKVTQKAAPPAEGTPAAETLRQTQTTQITGASGPLLASSDVVARYPDIKTAIARVQSSFNLQAKLVYGQQADTEFEYGLKHEGADWTISGTITVSNSLGTSISGQINGNVAKRYQSDFDFVDKIYCTGQIPVCMYGREAERWKGGLYAQDEAHYNPPWTPNEKCYEYPTTMSDDGISTTAASNVKIAAAASVNGLSIGAKSGYSDNVKIIWQVVDKTKLGYSYCFQSKGGVPWTEGGEIYAITGK
ncbi:hypothetical protein [Nonomuraea typhae]|uniref:DNRLRE domain-containing protein n=1 Tax=Nonomuraea typhae TaxID=2603600 RepID=A0ABW7YN69_9ACTN